MIIIIIRYIILFVVHGRIYYDNAYKYLRKNTGKIYLTYRSGTVNLY